MAAKRMTPEPGKAYRNKGGGEFLCLRIRNGCQRRFKIVRKRRLNYVVFWRSHITSSSVSLFKKCVHDLLLLTHKFLAFFQPV